MACVTIPEQNRRLETFEEINRFLGDFNIQYERWQAEKPIDPDASAEEILAGYAPEIERLKAERGYQTADVINVTPETPNLEVMLQKFRKEHTHTDDEVRYIVKGRGVFHIHPEGGPVFGVQLDAGDLINVPAGIKHWFDLCEDRSIRAIRLFKDVSGWTPVYTESDIATGYPPVCWGISYLPSEGANVPKFVPVVQP